MRLGVTGPLADASFEEPVFHVTEVVKLGSSDAASSDPSTADRGVALSLGLTSDPRREDSESKIVAPVEDEVPERHASENPQYVASSPHQEKDVTYACFDLPREFSPLNLYPLNGRYPGVHS